MPKGDVIGYIDCPWCRQLWDRRALATVKLNAKENCYVVCEGGPDGDQPSCGQPMNLAHRVSARLKARLAEAARRPAKPQPQPQPKANDDDATADPDRQPGPQPEPKPRAEPKRRSFSLLD